MNMMGHTTWSMLRQLNRRVPSSCGFVAGRRKRNDVRLMGFITFRFRVSSFSTRNVRHVNPDVESSLSATMSPYVRQLITAPCGRPILRPSSFNIIVRTMSKNASQKHPQAPSEGHPSFFNYVYDRAPSFIKNVCNEVYSLVLFVKSVSIRAVLLDLLRLSPRIAAAFGTLYLTKEYGLNVISCEGPSMEPTIIDESNTCVLLERWSHRIYGLERDVDCVGDVMFKASKQEQSENVKDQEEIWWLSLLRGIWDQHFASGLQRGDVVIMAHPLKESTICKRIVGIPGDTIERTDGGDNESSHLRVVPPGHLWIEGDNTRDSLDSRSYGEVPASLVIGKVVCRLWPLREYASLGLDANGAEHWRRVDARIGRGERPLPADGREKCYGSHVLLDKSTKTNRSP